MNELLHRELPSFMTEKPAGAPRALRPSAVARNLERIGDHATNIAEQITTKHATSNTGVDKGARVEIK